MEMIKKQVSSCFDDGKVFQSGVDNKVNFPLQLQLDDLDVFMRSIVDDPVPAGGPSPADFQFSLDDLLPPLPTLQPQLDDFEEFMRSIADQPVPGGPSPADFWISLDDLMPEGVPSVNNKANCPIQSQLEKFMMNIADDPDPGGPSPADLLFSLDDLLPEEAQCNLKYYTARGNEDPQAISSVKTDFPEPDLNEEDFLEMDDLIGSEPTGEFFANPEQALENHFDEFDGLLESDLFEDADMFFCDEDSSDQGLDSPHFVNKWENDVANPAASNYNLETNNANLQNGNYSSFRHWSHDQQCTVLFTPGSAQGEAISPRPPTIPRLPCDGNSANHHIVADQNDRDDDATDFWLSSALWSFVESIPAPPASAAETALVNRSFDRMSSFSRVRTNPRSSKVAGGVASAISSSSGKCPSGFFSFSVLGLLLAVMWMLAAGMSMRVL